MYSVFENLDQISPAAKLANRLKDNVVNASTRYVDNLAKSLELASKCETLVNTNPQLIFQTVCNNW